MLQASAMSDLDLLIRAIKSNPDDDLPRLALADLLEEGGESDRAELIRVQIAFHQSRCQSKPESSDAHRYFCDDSDCQHCNLDSRASDLLQMRDVAMGWIRIEDSNESRWVGSSRFLGSADPENWAFWVRGFVDSVGCSIDDWLRHGPSICAANPIRFVDLRDREPRPFEQNLVRWYSDLPSKNDPAYIGHLLDFLTPLIDPPHESGSRWFFSSAKEAQDALSVAAIAWAEWKNSGA